MDGVVMKRWKHWELALLLALGVTLLWGAFCVQRQEMLSGKMIRLHVIANTDSASDQQIKLQVRDRVLHFTADVLQGIEDRETAEEALREALPELENISRAELGKLGCGDSVQVLLEPAEFPQKQYAGFALPAGQYLALRVVIGRGEGRNWWCVVYPALCTAACSDLPQTAAAAGFSRDELELITRENRGYELRFRSVELWQQLRRFLGK